MQRAEWNTLASQSGVFQVCFPPFDGGLAVWDSHLRWNFTVFQMPTTVGFGSLVWEIEHCGQQILARHTANGDWHVAQIS